MYGFVLIFRGVAGDLDVTHGRELCLHQRQEATEHRRPEEIALQQGQGCPHRPLPLQRFPLPDLRRPRPRRQHPGVIVLVGRFVDCKRMHNQDQWLFVLSHTYHELEEITINQ